MAAPQPRPCIRLAILLPFLLLLVVATFLVVLPLLVLDKGGGAAPRLTWGSSVRSLTAGVGMHAGVVDSEGGNEEEHEELRLELADAARVGADVGGAVDGAGADAGESESESGFGNAEDGNGEQQPAVMDWTGVFAAANRTQTPADEEGGGSLDRVTPAGKLFDKVMTPDELAVLQAGELVAREARSWAAPDENKKGEEAGAEGAEVATVDPNYPDAGPSWAKRFKKPALPLRTKRFNGYDWPDTNITGSVIASGGPPPLGLDPQIWRDLRPWRVRGITRADVENTRARRAVLLTERTPFSREIFTCVVFQGMPYFLGSEMRELAHYHVPRMLKLLDFLLQLQSVAKLNMEWEVAKAAHGAGMPPPP